MKTTKKAMLLTVCALVLVAATMMGTMAYLTVGDRTVTNTFVAGQLIEDKEAFKLEEHVAARTDGGKYSLTDEVTQANTYTVVPGVNLPKDPYVKVEVLEDSYLFLEVINGLPEEMTFDIDSLWTALTDSHGDPVTKNSHPIYYRTAGTVKPSDGVITVNILASQQVKVDSSLDVSELAGDASKTLVFNAYLGQANSDAYTDALGAWNALFAA